MSNRECDDWMPPPARPQRPLRHGADRRFPNGRRRRRLEKRRRRARVVVVLAAAGAAVALAGGLATTGGVVYTAVESWRASCTLEALRPVSIGQNSFVYAGDGSLLGVIASERNRQAVRLEEMSVWLGKATVAIEDRRFYEHDGLDYEGIARAVLENVRDGRIVEGGSTLTQQLVGNLYIGREERSFERKLEEACLALKLEDAWSKRRILQIYLNRVFYGNRAYGVEAAARTYFGRPARELGPAQAALLAGLPQAPSLYDPFRRPATAKARRDQVLAAMRDVGYLGAERYARLVAKPLGLRPGSLYSTVREPYFFAYVRRLLIDHYGVETVRSGGLRVYTTVHPRFQRLAREAIASTLDQPGDPASAIVAINPRNGAIRAMTAVAPGRRRLQFNLAEQGRRQAGSAFKTFVLAEAIRRGVNPDTTLYLSAPFRWDDPSLPEPWDVKTYDGSSYGPSTIAQATLRSDNTVYARLTLDVGPASVARLARPMGITTELEAVASIGLGSNSVSPLEMASAYATLAAGGVYRLPMGIRRVVLASGRVDGAGVWARRGQRRVLTRAQAYEVTKLLEANIQRGTGVGAAIGRPAAGKTGTTDSHTDAWFVGYTPTLAAAVWVGYPQATREMTSVHGISVAGGTFPATIWARFLGPALAPTPPTPWPVPDEGVDWQPWAGANRYVPPPPPMPPRPPKNAKHDDEKPGQGGADAKPPKQNQPPADNEGDG